MVAREPPARPLTPEDRADLTVALLVWRYVGHDTQKNGPGWDSMARQTRALELAKKLGLKDDYLRAVFDGPVLSVTVKDLDPPAKAMPAKKKRRRPAPNRY